MANNNFKVNASNFLGSEHDDFKSDLMGLAFSKPTEYIKIHKLIKKTIKTDATTAIYNTFYNILTEGTDKDGKEIPEIEDLWGIAVGSTASQPSSADSSSVFSSSKKKGFRPCVPNQIVNEVAMNIASEFDKIVNEVIETYLINADDLNTANAKLGRKDRATNIL